MTVTFGTLPVPDKFPKKALYETAAATAVLLAHERTGYPLVDEEIALEAFARVRGFAEKHGLGILLLLYKAVSDYDNMNALDYDGRIRNASSCWANGTGRGSTMQSATNC